MKTTRNLKLALATPAVAVCLACVHPLAAQTSGSSAGTGAAAQSGMAEDRTSPGTQGDRADAPAMRSDRYATASAMGHKQPKRGEEFKNHAVRGDDGREIGKISDLVIDSESGRITHAVIHEGGVLGIGGTRKAISFDSLEMTEGQEGLTLASTEWQSAREFREDQLASLGSSESTGMTTADTSAEAAEGLAGGSLVLASKLDDIDIRGQNGREIGEVDDIVVELDERRASLLVEVDDAVSGDDDRSFVVGFNRVTLGGSGDNRTLTTELEDSDFRTAAANVPSLDQPYIWLEQEDHNAVAE